MKITIISNFGKGNAEASLPYMVDFFIGSGCSVNSYMYNYEGNYPKEAFAQCDIVLAVGGDGTIIHTAKICAQHEKPILGINAGTLGYTAGMEYGEMDLLCKLLDGNYIAERRLMIEAQLVSPQGEKQFLALNEFVISGEVSKIIDYEMAVDHHRVYGYRADGFILATPTGSTAYALSAGGPVIEPSIACMEYMPICPHSFMNRSIIFADQTTIHVRIPERNINQVYLSADGENREVLHHGAEICFQKAAFPATFIRFSDKSFYDILNKKMVSVNRDPVT